MYYPRPAITWEAEPEVPAPEGPEAALSPDVTRAARRPVWGGSGVRMPHGRDLACYPSGFTLRWEAPDTPGQFVVGAMSACVRTRVGGLGA